MFKTLHLAIFLFLPITATAHSPLASSFPDNGAKLNVSPAEIILVFKSPAKLVRVSFSALSKKQSKNLWGGLFGDHNRVPVELETNPLLKIDKRHPISLPLLRNGKYLFVWRAMGKDGHVIKGEITFAIDGI